MWGPPALLGPLLAVLPLAPSVSGPSSACIPTPLPSFGRAGTNYATTAYAMAQPIDGVVSTSVRCELRDHLGRLVASIGATAPGPVAAATGTMQAPPDPDLTVCIVVNVARIDGSGVATEACSPLS